jgi:hypothetical protein
MIKKCKKCQVNKFILDFQFRKDTTKYRNGCKKCLSKQKAINYQENREQRLIQATNRRKDNPEYMHNWRNENKKYLKEYSKNKWKENKKEMTKKYREYHQKNPYIKTNLENKRRAQKINATPIWSEKDDIREIYKQCEAISKATGNKHHVHHIYPLQEFSKIFSGLHVIANLEILDEDAHKERHRELREIYG